jgi:hypothetical protein
VTAGFEKVYKTRIIAQIVLFDLAWLSDRVREHLYIATNVVCDDCVPVNFHRKRSAEYGILQQIEVLEEEEGQNIQDQ